MKYTTEEALKEFFENLKRSDYTDHTEEYNMLTMYKTRWKAGKLGKKAAERVLKYGGFELKSYYVKKRGFNLRKFLTLLTRKDKENQ